MSQDETHNLKKCKLRFVNLSEMKSEFLNYVLLDVEIEFYIIYIGLTVNGYSAEPVFVTSVL